jgi:hypothetical protein
VVAQAYILITGKAEAGGLPVQGQPRLHSETLLKKKKVLFSKFSLG